MFGDKTTKKLTPIKGKSWETELELAKMFKRPLRTYEEDPPYYPWLVPEPVVNFHLNFKE